jgi:hypothetical protein
MRRLLLCASAAALAAACATPGDLADVVTHDSDTLRTVCDDLEALAVDIQDDGDLASTQWIDRIDGLGVRAMSLGTDQGERLGEGIARWSVGLDNQDLDLAVEGLEDIERICS